MRSRSSSSNGIAHTTGPKISSRTTDISGLVSVNTVGWTKYPASPTRSPPVTTCARLSAGFEIAGHPPELLVRDERAKLGLGIETMSDTDLRGTVGNTLHQPIKHALMGIEPRAGGAALPHVEEDRARRAADRDIHVGIGKDDRRRLAAELERDFFQIAGRGLDDQFADLGRPGEGDLVDIRMGRERCPGSLAEPGQDVDDAVREAGFLDHWPRRDALSGVCSAGFRTMVQPAASAGAIFQAAIISGKFHGMIWPTTPTGSRKV